MLWLSVGVNHRKFGGLAELAAVTKSVVETLPPVNMLGLVEVVVNPVNGKWSLPLGHPLSQYACHVRPAVAIRSMRVGALIQQEYPSEIPWSDPEIRAV